MGLFMISFWAMLLVTDQVPQDQKPWAISFHVAGEFLTAILLTISGVTLWLKKTRARVLSAAALGMLLYTVIVSPGYYAQQNEQPMVAMFTVLIILTTIAIITLITNSKKSPERALIPRPAAYKAAALPG